MSGLHNRS